MAFLDFLTGTPARTEQFPRFSPQQVSGQNQVLSQALAQLNPSNQQQFDFAPIEAQARTNFQTQTIPSIAERFTRAGGQRSGAFPASLSQAGSGLEQSLAALRSNYNLSQQSNQNQLWANLLGHGLNPQNETAYFPGQPGLLGGLGIGAAQGAGSALPLLLSQLGQNPESQYGQQGNFMANFIKLLPLLLKLGAV